MKNLKLLTLTAAVAGLTLAACEKKVVIKDPAATTDTTPSTATREINNTVNQQELPAKVKSFLDTHYPNIRVAKYEMKIKTTGNEYEVKLDNGVEAEFDKNENWTELKDYNGVPTDLVPAKITAYVNQNYKNIKIKSIEKDASKNKIDIDLLNDTDLDFDLQGNFLKIDK